jgi:signal transduction histidine kinase
VGIPKADLPKLFSKFFRAANVIHLQTDGSGLGLFIVKNIIVRHGGQVWVESEEGKGTTFTVVIPLIAELLPKDENAVMPTAEVPVAKA